MWISRYFSIINSFWYFWEVQNLNELDFKQKIEYKKYYTKKLRNLVEMLRFNI